MNWWHKVLTHLGAFFRKEELDAEMDQEMRSHIEMQTQENIRGGMEPEEARYAAVRQFGRVEQVKETCREQRGVAWLENLWQDAGFGLRMLLKTPGFTVVVILSLSLGVGATTAIFSIVDRVVINPLPGLAANRLVMIGERRPDSGNEPYFPFVSKAALEALQDKVDSFEDFAWADFLGLEQKTEGFVDQLSGAIVSPNFFTLWRVSPLLGRTFVNDEAGPVDAAGIPHQGAVIVLSYSTWKSLLAGDLQVVGKTVELSGRHFTVIGVMPPYFQIPGGGTKFWVPGRSLRVPSEWEASPNVQVFARLKSRVTLRQTQALLDVLAQRIAKDEAQEAQIHGVEIPKHGPEFWVKPARFVFARNEEDFQRTLLGLFGGIGFVLLIVCANIANLTLARVEQRQHEWAVRAALGAGRWRLIRQLLTENTVLACLAGLAGLAVAHWGLKLIASWLPSEMPRAKPIQLDASALGFTLLVCVVAGLGFGLVPAWQASRTRLSEGLKHAGGRTTVGRDRTRYRSGLVIIEVALALVLLAGAGLMVESVMRLLEVKPGFDPASLFYVKVWLPRQTAPDKPPTKENQTASGLSANVRFRILAQRLASMPGIKAVGTFGGGGADEYQIEGQPAPWKLSRLNCGVEEEDIFHAMRIPPQAGRYFNRSDTGQAAGTAIINESMARFCWPGQSAVGRKFSRRTGAKEAKLYEVIGVVGDVRLNQIHQPVKPTFYESFKSDSTSSFRILVVRGKDNAEAVVPTIRAALKNVEPGMRMPSIGLCAQHLYDSTLLQRTYMLWLLALGGVGLVLAALGIYGVLAYSVVRRTREFGLRIALGAKQQDVVAMVMRQGARQIGLGVATGFIAAFWLTRLLRHELFQVTPLDPVAFLCAVLLLSAIALTACFLPARRAAKVSPMEALRNE